MNGESVRNFSPSFKTKVHKTAADSIQPSRVSNRNECAPGPKEDTDEGDIQSPTALLLAPCLTSI